MHLILLVTLTMIAFAANSVLNRLAVDGGYIDPSSFAVIRVLAGAVVLGMVLSARGGQLPLMKRGRIVGALSLSAYMIGFSLAYATLDAGLGALILFGVVQIVMFAWGAATGARPTVRQMAGAGIAFVGLLIALWPGPGGIADAGGAILMTIAGIGWAAYTLAGRGAPNPLGATAANFILALPILALLLVGQGLSANMTGVGLAALAGGVTSGLGYTLWYAVLPRLPASTAAVVQLSVPIIAIIGGALLLGEAVTGVILIAAGFVVGGIALAVTTQSLPKDRK
ncbi:putative cystine transporter YijE [Ascidiaceihabitans donghaensis]|uniref:Putative cystine transporter YijE n=1 Tax=Ascidiaceihabitans donghaensis TaxID=1510460 RepID=A0A2R8BB59_9RHOB|nr:DMT family transporter [Ascidiaceihabitans donghaensis]SPH20132.1 putative cystine transporter YijE [Ascidiaceihabitans donghaensis]